jgi:hypothetical protein
MTRRLAVVVACALGLSVASAGAASSPIVPPGGQLAGRGYGEWLATSWKILLSKEPLPLACQKSGEVTVLLGGLSGKKEHHTCELSKGTDVYAPGFSAECSTVEKAPFHGSTTAELKACAKRQYAVDKEISVTLGGKAVDHAKYVAATKTFAVHMPKRNLLGSKKRDARAAAYGEGLLLKDLSVGSHTLHVRITATGFTGDVTYKLNVLE